MRLQIRGAIAALIVLAGGSATSQESMTAAIEQPTPVLPAAVLTPQDCWDDWLQANGLNEGTNSLDDGRFIVAVSSSDIIVDEAGDAWVTARNALYGGLRVNALATISNNIRQKLSSEVSVEWLRQGVTPPPAIENTVEGVSLAERAEVLTGHALDAQIRRFDPSWDGTGRTDAERRQRAFVLATRFRERLSSQSELLAAGATTVVQCEGRSAEDGTPTAGKYEVLIGVVWSPRLAYFSHSLSRGNQVLEPGAERLSLEARFAALYDDNPDWMALTLGTRVWTDENGEQMIVGFGAIPSSLAKVTDNSAAELAAVIDIRRFAGEAITVERETATAFDTEVYEDDSVEVFDASRFRQLVEGVSRGLDITGAQQVKSWRGTHPISGKPMEVVAVAWKPSWSTGSQAFERLLQAVDSGAGADSLTDEAVANGVALPVQSGASSSASDY